MGNRFVSRQKLGAVTLALMLSMFAAGCKKKVPAPVAPPPPPPKQVETIKPDKPTVAQFEAEPSTIERGQAATLRWNVSGETTDVSISSGIGTVAKMGTRQVYPSNTTTYTLTATGPGGETTMVATVNVTSPAPPPPAPAPTVSKRSASDILAQDVKDVYFDYDSSTIREDARAILTRNADAIKQIIAEYPSSKIVVEGHADERGSAEYNLGLSDRRATAAKEFLVQLGVSGDRLSPVSYGKERPQCTEANETCWQSNRRAHFSLGQ